MKMPMPSVGGIDRVFSGSVVMHHRPTRKGRFAPAGGPGTGAVWLITLCPPPWYARRGWPPRGMGACPCRAVFIRPTRPGCQGRVTGLATAWVTAWVFPVERTARIVAPPVETRRRRAVNQSETWRRPRKGPRLRHDACRTRAGRLELEPGSTWAWHRPATRPAAPIAPQGSAMTADAGDLSDLLRRASEGDAQALGDLLARHRDRLRLMAALRLDRRLKGRIDPSDVL